MVVRVNSTVRHMKRLWSVFASFIFGTLVAGQALGADASSQVIQAVLDCPKVEAYLHPEIKGRIPLLIAGAVIPDGLCVTKYGKSIVKVILAESDTRAVIVFDELLIASSSANARFRIPLEGVSASLTLTKISNTWRISSVQIIEK